MLTRRYLIENFCKQCGDLTMAIKSTICGYSSRIYERRSNGILSTLNTSRPSTGSGTASTARSNLYKIFMLFPLLLYAFSPTIEGPAWNLFDSFWWETEQSRMAHPCRQAHQGRMSPRVISKLPSFSLLPNATLSALTPPPALLHALT